MSYSRRLIGPVAVVILMAAVVMFGRVGAAPPAQSEPTVTPPSPSPATEYNGGGISVVGHGSVLARPDTAYINLGFQAENTSAKQAQAEAASKMNAVIEAVRAQGIAQADIQTSNYSIWRDPQRNVFTASYELRVTIRQIDKSSGLIDAVVNAGANSVSGISFGIENTSALEKQAREKAMNEAAANAAELARLAGVKLGPAVSISENAAMPPVPYPVMGREMGAPAADASMPIEPGKNEITVNIQVTYAIVR